jgi:hypothetical protein
MLDDGGLKESGERSFGSKEELIQSLREEGLARLKEAGAKD